jgi:lipid-A-disaccharide synthase-like uncharacterized protein
MQQQQQHKQRDTASAACQPAGPQPSSASSSTRAPESTNTSTTTTGRPNPGPGSLQQPCLPYWFRFSTIIVPVASILYLFFDSDFSFGSLIHNPAISIPLLTWGTAGQIIFTFRFVYQWIHSEKLQKSVLPPVFWWISLIGSLMVLVYAVFRYDPVLFLGQVFGTVIYGRNLYLHFCSDSSRSGKKSFDTLLKK